MPQINRELQRLLWRVQVARGRDEERDKRFTTEVKNSGDISSTDKIALIHRHYPEIKESRQRRRDKQ